MNRSERHHVRLRAQGRRRIGAATGWSVAAGAVLSAVFGVMFAQATPPAAAAAAAAPAVPAVPADPAPAASSRPAPVTIAPTPGRHSHALQPPTTAPKVSRAAPRVSSGAT